MLTKDISKPIPLTMNLNFSYSSLYLNLKYQEVSE